MKYLMFTLLALAFVFLIVFLSHEYRTAPENIDYKSDKHIYSSWDVMEFDKCVAAWLIVRFIDKDAQFVFYPQGTEIEEGIVFDVPGAVWSRKHKMCTSDCILQSLGINDPTVERIVEMAHHTELNFWQLESFPEAKEHFYDVKAIMEQYPKSVKCFEKTNVYFDNLYENLKKGNFKRKEEK